MKKLTANNYRQDKYYIPVVKAVTEILAKQMYITPIGVFVTLGLLSNDHVVRWKKGSIPYLERVIMCSLSKASRILRLIRFHCHDLNMIPSITVYKAKKAKKGVLRFSKTGERNLEEAYARHFVSPLLKKHRVQQDKF
ncbi:hypothetical protein [Endozoicomonas sp. ONNA2]|uniref:hypothetical protein n=1 Tax=Endozoicomonas sp. ONNA2 TaxID=2828741 RepID=UPI002148194C|nr:hypothetical protein [Endozoicomonas sp. ONNA2]